MMKYFQLQSCEYLSFIYAFTKTVPVRQRHNRIFKALLWINKSFKFIDFNLAKHTLISLQRKSSLELVWKISNLKIKMSLLGSRSSSTNTNTLTHFISEQKLKYNTIVYINKLHAWIEYIINLTRTN